MFNKKICKYKVLGSTSFSFQYMYIVFKIIILLDPGNNWDEKVNNSVVPAGETVKGSLV